jgi:transcriptional regulator with PAS, ATPase and Fis domain
MHVLRGLIAKAAQVPMPVLVEGETGTGKELVAQELHRQSRLPGRLVCVNAAALPETLAEAELFGFERGAFTGAIRSQPGRIAEAHDGTLFLDEAADISRATQARLLRTLDSGEVTRLGSSRTAPIRFRLVAAVQRPPEQLIADGAWRQDFRYRVTGIRLRLPALRERQSDIPVLGAHFVRALGSVSLPEESLRQLMDFPWPGNVRQLRQVIERAVYLGAKQPTAGDLREALEAELESPAVQPSRPTPRQLSELRATVGGSVSRLAALLRISRATAYRWLKEADPVMEG